MKRFFVVDEGDFTLLAIMFFVCLSILVGLQVHNLSQDESRPFLEVHTMRIIHTWAINSPQDRHSQLRFVFLFLTIFVFITGLFASCKKISLDEYEISIGDVLFRINSAEWSDVRGVYVNQFTNLDQLKVPWGHIKRTYGYMKVDNVRINVPRKKIDKWIFIDSDGNGNCRNYLKYLIPQRGSSLIKFPYREDIAAAIEEFYEKELIHTTIEYTQPM